MVKVVINLKQIISKTIFYPIEQSIYLLLRIKMVLTTYVSIKAVYIDPFNNHETLKLLKVKK